MAGLSKETRRFIKAQQDVIAEALQLYREGDLTALLQNGLVLKRYVSLPSESFVFSKTPTGNFTSLLFPLSVYASRAGYSQGMSADEYVNKIISNPALYPKPTGGITLQPSVLPPTATYGDLLGGR